MSYFGRAPAAAVPCVRQPVCVSPSHGASPAGSPGRTATRSPRSAPGSADTPETTGPRDPASNEDIDVLGFEHISVRRGVKLHKRLQGGKIHDYLWSGSPPRSQHRRQHLYLTVPADRHLLPTAASLCRLGLSQVDRPSNRRAGKHSQAFHNYVDRYSV